MPWYERKRSFAYVVCECAQRCRCTCNHGNGNVQSDRFASSPSHRFATFDGSVFTGARCVLIPKCVPHCSSIAGDWLQTKCSSNHYKKNVFDAISNVYLVVRFRLVFVAVRRIVQCDYIVCIAQLHFEYKNEHVSTMARLRAQQPSMLRLSIYWSIERLTGWRMISHRSMRINTSTLNWKCSAKSNCFCCESYFRAILVSFSVCSAAVGRTLCRSYLELC